MREGIIIGWIVLSLIMLAQRRMRRKGVTDRAAGAWIGILAQAVGFAALWSIRRGTPSIPPLPGDILRDHDLITRGPSGATRTITAGGIPGLKSFMFLPVLCLLLQGCSPAGRVDDPATIEQQVLDTERAFARTMALRDYDAFTSFLSEEAVFYSGDSALRGMKEVADRWKQFFEGADAPFSWEPERVEVLPSGTLALSTGPVSDPGGRTIATFTSIWRQEAPGRWRIVFDRGTPACDNP